MDIEQKKYVTKIHEKELLLYKLENQITYILDDFWLENRKEKLSTLREQCKGLRRAIKPYYDKLYKSLNEELLSKNELMILHAVCNLSDEIEKADGRINELYVDLHQGLVTKEKTFYNILKNRTLQSQKARKHVLDLLGCLEVKING